MARESGSRSCAQRSPEDWEFVNGSKKASRPEDQGLPCMPLSSCAFPPLGPAPTPSAAAQALASLHTFILGSVVKPLPLAFWTCRFHQGCLSRDLNPECSHFSPAFPPLTPSCPGLEFQKWSVRGLAWVTGSSQQQKERDQVLPLSWGGGCPLQCWGTLMSTLVTAIETAVSDTSQSEFVSV